MKWIGVEDDHHSLSHKPDSDKQSQDKLIKINTWFCQQMACLVERLDKTPEPGGDGTLLDNTTVVWTNELGKGNSHTLNDVPLVLVGGGLDFKMGRSLKYKAPCQNLWVRTNRKRRREDEGIGAFSEPRDCLLWKWGV